MAGRGLLSRWCGDRRGNIAIMFAASLPVLFATAAIAVDGGYLFTERRTAQGAVDLAALAAAADMANAEAAARATLLANDVGAIESLTVTPGRYLPDPNVHHTDRFEPGMSPHDAVEVAFTTRRPYFFARIFMADDAAISVRSIAATAASATFSVGSRLLAVRGGLPNQVLGALTGGSVNLTVMDYNALVDADISLGDQLTALAGEIGITAGTYDTVLASDVTLGDWLRAMAAVTAANGDTTAAAAITSLLLTSTNLGLELPLEQMIALGDLGAFEIGSVGSGLGATFNAMEFATSAVQIANGERQVEIDLGVSIPGLTSLKLQIDVGERPQYGSWAAAGGPSTSVYTAQTRLRLIAQVAGGSLLPGVSLRLPIAIDMAHARARLASTSCESTVEGAAGAEIAVTPGIVTAWIGETGNDWSDLDAPAYVRQANILSLPLVRVKGSALVEATNTTETSLSFTADDIENGVIKRAETSDAIETLVTSLVRNLNLSVEVVGLGIGVPSGLRTTVATLLGGVAAPLDAVVHELLQTLGLHLGEADVRVHGAQCGGARLAG
ncbi:MAG: TadG family pilus assembly protein [Hyphomicrobiaceae bacterium]|nr:TadG family pilus assembly protein [Hyphomicrobiaceae bacterium]